MKVLFAQFLFISAALLFFQSCATALNPRLGAEDDVREAALRYWFVDASQFQNIKAYYLSFGSINSGIDPSDEFMRRFEGHIPPVRLASQCEHATSSVRDRETGEIGLLFWTRRANWADDKNVEIESGWYLDGLGASGCVLHMALQNQDWIVKNRTACWES
jgi:hypothetical protein